MKNKINQLTMCKYIPYDMKLYSNLGTLTYHSTKFSSFEMLPHFFGAKAIKSCLDLKNFCYTTELTSGPLLLLSFGLLLLQLFCLLSGSTVQLLLTI